MNRRQSRNCHSIGGNLVLRSGAELRKVSMRRCQVASSSAVYLPLPASKTGTSPDLRPCFDMVLPSPFQCSDPPHSRFPWEPALFGYDLLESLQNIWGHFGWRAGDIHSSSITQKIPDSLAILPHLMLHIDLLWLIPREGHEEAPAFHFWEDPAFFSGMVGPEILI